MRRFLAVALAAALVLTLAGTAFAAKGGKNGGGAGTGTSGTTITVPNGVFGQTDTAVTTPGGLWVDATCSQNGMLVYEQWVLSDASGNAVLKLGPTPSWSGGAASCGASANVLTSSGNLKAVAYASFSVAP